MPHILFFFIFFFLQLPWKVDDVENAMPIDDVKMVFFNDMNELQGRFQGRFGVSAPHGLQNALETPLQLIHTSKIIVARAFWNDFAMLRVEED